MLKKGLIAIIGVLFIILSPVSAQADELKAPIETTSFNVIQPLWVNISGFDARFTLSSDGKANIYVVLNSYAPFQLEAEAYLQQYSNGDWVTIQQR